MQHREFIMVMAAVLLTIMVTTTNIIRIALRRRGSVSSLPPGPRALPVIGNLLQLITTSPAHDSFAKLARKHGPLMTLRVGSMLTVVVSSSEVAREMFKRHDKVLAGRKIYDAMRGEESSMGSLITAQYGAHWKMLRRLHTTQFFAATQLDATRAVRARCVDRMLRFVEEASMNGTTAIDVGRYFFLMAFNLIGNLMFSKDLLDPCSKQGAAFFYHAGEVMQFAGKPNMVDFFPSLRPFDLQGIRKKTQFHVEQAFRIVGEFIRERMKNKENQRSYGERNAAKDFLDVLLEHQVDDDEASQEVSRWSSRMINVIVFEMFTAGTDTTTSTLEWAMTELLNNPKILAKLQEQLRTTKGPNNRLEEEDIQNLPLLTAVIKETLRLHPPLPFLVPHKAMSPCEMLGYHIPEETQVLVNVWAIGRDPSSWSDPLVFKPERFLSNPGSADYTGQKFEFIPFGAGRRICPGIPLARRILPLALGSMLHRFDWSLPKGLEAEDIDMRERMGITVRKFVPLKAVPVPKT